MLDPNDYSAGELRDMALQLRNRARELRDLNQPVAAAEVESIATGHEARADRLDAESA